MQKSDKEKLSCGINEIPCAFMQSSINILDFEQIHDNWLIVLFIVIIIIIIIIEIHISCMVSGFKQANIRIDNVLENVCHHRIMLRLSSYHTISDCFAEQRIHSNIFMHIAYVYRSTLFE